MLFQLPGIETITLDRKGEHFPLVLSAIEKKDPLKLLENADYWMNEDEQLLYQDLKAPRKCNSFLLGRYAAKLGLAHFLGNRDLLQCSVCRGALGQPLVKSELRDVPEVSLSHSGTIGAALVFPPGQQFALDIECILPPGNRGSAIKSRLTERELSLLKRASRGMDENILLYIFWTMKEALSKVLRCGLTLPFKALEVSELSWEGDVFHGRYTHFSQYRSVAECNGSLALTLVFPWKSKLVFSDGRVL